MILLNGFFSDDEYNKNVTFIIRVHRVMCTLSIMLAVYWLFMCILSVLGALQDMEKYGGLGFSYSFWFYLCRNRFLVHVGCFLCMTIELLLYSVQYRYANQKKPIWISIWYFSFMLILHTAAWLHASFLVQDSSLTLIKDAIWEYRFFANKTILPSYGYFILYLLHVHKLKSGKNS